MALTLRLRHQSLTAVLRRGLRVVLSPTAAGRLTLAVRGPHGVVLGRRSGSLRRAQPTAIVIRLSARRVARLVSRGRIRVTIQARLSVAGARHALAGRSLVLKG